MVCLPNPPPDGFPGGGGQRVAAVGADKDRVGEDVRRASKSGQLHLLEDGFCPFEEIDSAESLNYRVVGSDVRRAVELLHLVEGGEGLGFDEAGHDGGGDEVAILVSPPQHVLEEIPEKVHSTAFGEDDRHLAAGPLIVPEVEPVLDPVQELERLLEAEIQELGVSVGRGLGSLFCDWLFLA
ncbi:SBP (S-ribonuclease binding protein) family protein [Striga asiatica]|uniref:SBP (S-ribonuclease binding protein) family protein n=1 Tax=Striga asiatica TaxID=4170 RepID=A0A5A7PF72_STRAF|nr:SBP (S-ribonuclease binding protein) family protein [Striga asiatica]